MFRFRGNLQRKALSYVIKSQERLNGRHIPLYIQHDPLSGITLLRSTYLGLSEGHDNRTET